MLRTHLYALVPAMAALFALPLQAQQRAGAAPPEIHMRLSIGGTLEATDSKGPDGSRYDVWAYRARTDRKALVRVLADFDSRVEWGEMRNGRFVATQSVEGAANGGFADIQVSPVPGTTYTVRVIGRNGGTGSYSIEMEPVASAGS